MVAMFQCFQGIRSSRRSRAVTSDHRQNWVPGTIRTLRTLFTRKKQTRLRDEEQGLVTPPSTQQHAVHAYGSFYGRGNAQISSAVLEEALFDPNVHIGELREFFPGFDGAPVTPSSPSVSIPTPASVRTRHPTPQTSAMSRAASSVYPVPPADSNPTIAPPARLEPTPESFASDYAVIKTLKRNNEGPVSLVKHKSTGKQFIIKQMRYLKTPDGQQFVPDEVYMMSQIKHSHPNIIQVEEILDDWVRGISNMVLEFCSAGDVDNLIESCRKRGEHVPAPVVLSIAAALIDASAFLNHGDVDFDTVTNSCMVRKNSRQAKILHRDIKPGNVFLRWPTDNSNYGLPAAVLADFGLAGLTEHNQKDTRMGTAGFWAPELAENPGVQGVCSEKSDIYSLGVTLFQLISAYIYDPEIDNIAQAFDFSSVRDHPRFLQLLEACLSPDPADRPAANELHYTSYLFKEHVRQWYEAGGRIPDSFWPAPFANDHYIKGQEPQHTAQPDSRSSPPRYSQASSPVQPNAPSMTAAIAHLPPLRRVNRLSDLQAVAGAEYAQEIADIPGPFTPRMPNFRTRVGVFPAESGQATAGATAPRGHFSWSSDDLA